MQSEYIAEECYRGGLSVLGSHRSPGDLRIRLCQGPGQLTPAWDDDGLPISLARSLDDATDFMSCSLIPLHQYASGGRAAQRKRVAGFVTMSACKTRQPSGLKLLLMHNCA